MNRRTPIMEAEISATPRRSRVLLAFDPLLLLAGLGLIVCSLAALRAVNHTDLEKQAVFAGVGLVLAVAVAVFDYSRLREYRYGLYGLLIAINVIVFAFPDSQAQNGATRHIPLPFIEPQPSEFGKLLLILALAGVAVERSRRLHERRTTLRILLLALLPAMIVIAQPDLGTGLVYVTIAAATLFFAGTSWKQLTALAALAVVAVVLVLAVAPAVGVNVVKGYQKQRLTTFISPPRVCNTQKDSTCYQLQESEIGIGSGQKTGRGIAGAGQKFSFIPEANDDFIFAVVGETYGFVGAAVVLSLYALLIWRSLRILIMAKNLFGTLVAGGILAMFMFQIFVNVGMTIGIMPVTGVPLPLLSYGGSSVIVSFLALGLLESIHIQARMAAKSGPRVLIA